MSTSGTEQLLFLEELASLLRPDPPLQRVKTRLVPPAERIRSNKKSGCRGKTGGRRSRAGSRERRCSHDVASSSIDARDFLNSAELVLLDQRKKMETQPTPVHERGKSEMTVKERKRRSKVSHSIDQSSSSGWMRGCSPSQNSYWLKESEEAGIQKWLRRKERESAAQRLAEKKERRQEKRKIEEKARLQQEREQLAKLAYQQWKDRKMSEEKARKTRNKRTNLVNTTRPAIFRPPKSI